MADYNKLITVAPDIADGYADRGVLNQQMGNTDAALKDYNRWIELAPNEPQAYLNRAQIYIQQKVYDKALTDLNNALRLSPQDADVSGMYLSRGYVNSLLKNTAKAADDYLQWARRIQSKNVPQDELRPGESVVVPMQPGAVYLFPFRANAGQKVTLSATARSGSNTDPLILVFDPQSKVIVADDDGGGDYNARIEAYTLPAEGFYTLALTHAGGGRTGPVRVLLQTGD
jgi:tetratricopeptide (TPR) repeat protein